MSDPRAELEHALRDLSIGEKGPVQDLSRPTVIGRSTPGSATSTPKPKSAKKAKEVVADSWEDEADLSGDEPVSAASPSLLTPTLSTEGPLDPPPTPISPQASQPWDAVRVGSPATGWQGSSGPTKRPEKQTAVAGRLIAGALGIRAPKRTEEQRAYDRAVKEQEIKRRNREREEAAKAKENEEKLKTSVWTD